MHDTRSDAPPAGDRSAETNATANAQAALAGAHADLIRALNEFIAKLNRPEQKGRWAWLNGWMNGPFVVTVLGGLIASLITLMYQQRAAERQKIREQEYALTTLLMQRSHDHYSQRQRMLSAFANEFPQSLNRLYRTKKMWLELSGPVAEAVPASGPAASGPAATGPAATGPAATGGRAPATQSATRAERLKEYRELNEKYMTSKIASALCAEAAATFDSGEVTEALKELNRSVDGIFYDATRLEEVEKFHDRANRQFEQVVAAMGGELRKDKSGNEFAVPVKRPAVGGSVER